MSMIYAFQCDECPEYTKELGQGWQRDALTGRALCPKCVKAGKVLRSPSLYSKLLRSSEERRTGQ